MITLNSMIVTELGRYNPTKKHTAETMAKAVNRACIKMAKAEGQKSNLEVVIKRPGQPRHFGDTTCWCVAWEAGPYEWAISASMLIGNITGKVVEPYYSFDLCFYPTED